MNYILILLLSLSPYYLKIYILCTECNMTTPILIQNECKLIYCSEAQFISGNCSINNTIIKTQWLNNIILFNDYKIRYGSLAVNFNGDMIYECSSEEADGIRQFYGLKKNGDFLFKDENGEDIPSKIMTIGSLNSYPIRFESSNTFVSINNTEYLLSISIYTGKAELYDFETNEASFVSTFDFTGFNIESTSNTFIKIDNNNTIEYLYTFNGQKQDDDRFTDFYIVLQKYSFSKNKISFRNNTNDGYKITNNKIINVVNSTRIVSSFITESKIIVAFYLSNNTFIIDLFNESLDSINSTILDYFTGKNIYYYEGIFNKCIHIKKNLGAFLYYLNNNTFTLPQLKIIDIDDDYSFKLKFSYELNITNDFTSDALLNDLLKISNKKFTSIISSRNRNILYILLFEFYNNNKNIKIRTYKIDLYELYNYKIYLELSGILYNNYLVLSSSVCNVFPCNNSNYMSSLIIFGYVNGSKISIDISQFLSEFNIDKKNNIINKALENIIIDNNIFGYEYQQKIKLVYIPNELNFYNIINEGKIKVNVNETLNYEHEINQSEIIKMSNKTYYFEFQYIVEEPNEENKINQYTIDIRTIDRLDNENIEDDDYLENNIFYSRSIKVEFKLCYELCNTCKNLGISFNDQKCLSCLENYVFSEDNCYPENILSDNENNTEYINHSLHSSDFTTDSTNIKEYSSDIIYISDNILNTTSDYNIISNTIDYSANNIKKDINCSSSYFYKYYECVEFCSYEELLNNNCSLNKSSKKNNTIIYNTIKNLIKYYTHNDNLILKTKDNYIFQLTDSLINHELY